MLISASKKFLLASALPAALLLQGCAIGNFQPSGPVPVTAASSITGSVHGGQQPISGSTIGLYTVGAAGYGAGATSIITAGETVTTSASGGFNLTSGTDYTCPSTTALTYITATSGNPGLSPASATNPNIQLVALLGACGGVANASVNINEVTTAAAAYALGQYFTTTFGAASTDGFGAPATTQAGVGITNAFSVYNNLVTNATGTAVVSGTNTSSLGNITYTPDPNKLNTIADMLASCVNTAGGTAGDTSNCGTLFGDTPPAGATAPTDTLQAAVDLSLNPTSTNANSSASNISALFGLVTAASPFPAGAQPTDWTIGINYTAGTSSTQTLINGANDIAIDSGGNVWLINYNTAASATESLTELSPTGTPIVNPLNSGAAAPASLAAVSPRNLAIDTNNNIYISSTSGSAYAFKYNSATATTSSLILSGQPYGVAIDGNNNVFFSHNSGSTIGIDEFPGGTIASTNRVEYPFNSSITLTQYAAISSAGNLLLTTGTNTTSTVLQVSGLNASTCTTYPCTTTNDTSLTATYATVTAGTPNITYGIAAATAGFFFANQTGNTLGYATTPTTGSTFGSSVSLNQPRKVAVDGNNVAWVCNRGNGSVSEITTAGAILSPTTSTSSVVGFVHSGITSATGIAVDPSGNVWISSGNVTATSPPINSVFELIGAAAPATTPLALAIKNGSVGARP